MRLIDPVRVYDTRPGSGHEGAGQKLTRRKVRKVPVSMSTETLVNLTVVSDGRSGWLSVGGTSNVPTGTSIVNFDEDGIANVVVPLATPTGHIFVWASEACELVVDVYGGN